MTDDVIHNPAVDKVELVIDCASSECPNCKRCESFQVIKCNHCKRIWVSINEGRKIAN